MKKFQEKYPFKDLKTKVRMQKTVPEPEFELSNKDEIENRFEEFCQKIRQRESDDFFDLPKGSRNNNNNNNNMSHHNDNLEKPFVRKELKKFSTKLIVTETMNDMRYSIEDSRRFLKSAQNREHHDSLDYDSIEAGIPIEKHISNHLRKAVTKEGNPLMVSQLLDEK